MIHILYYLIAAALQFSSPEKVRASNVIIENFEFFFKKSEFQEAINAYKSLEMLEVPISKTMKFNAANCYYALKDTLKSKALFEQTIKSPDITLQNRSYNMLARISLDKKDTLQAIQILQNAIRNNNSNEDLLFNYEYLKRKFKNNNPPLPPSSASMQEEEKQENGMAEKSNEKEDELSSTNPPKINREQALQILEALKSKEIYFIPHKFDSTKQNNKTNYGNW